MIAPIPEIQVAVKFIVSCMYGKLPRRRADLFAEELSAAIQTKFQGHWYADQPTKGSAYRCLHFTSKEVDPVFNKASESAGIAFSEISTYIPSELSVWVDPGEVSYQIGEKGTQSVLYRRNMIGQEEFGHDVSQQTQTEIMNGSDGQKLYTVAEFMSTKFGSMKNRGQRARALAQQQQQQQQQAAQQQQMQQQQQAQQQAQQQQQLFQQSQQLIRQQMQQMNQMKKPMHPQVQPNFQQQQAFLQQQLLIQKLAMQNLAKLQNQKAMVAHQNRPKPQFASRWNETTPLQSCAQQQPELQLNMNSQGGFVPQFINNSPSSRAESNPSPGSDSSFQSSTWSAPASPIGSSKMDSCWASSSNRWSPCLSNDWSSGTEDSGHASNDDDLDLDQEIFDQIAALRIEAH